MRACRIETEPFQLTSLVDFESHVEMNQHGTAVLKGYVSKEENDTVAKMVGEETWCSVWFYDEDGGRNILFCGYMEDAEINVQGDTYLLTAYIKTGTGLMDRETHTRVYQNGGTTYQQIQESHLAGYFQGNFLMGFDAGSIESMAVQYQETDWQFMKRLASRKNTVLFPNERSAGVKYTFGIIEERMGGFLFYESYSERNKHNSIRKKRESGITALTDHDAIGYQVKSREIYFIGDMVLFQGSRYIISAVQRKWEENELYNYYTLGTVGSVKQETYYNKDLIGASLSGKIASISRDMVQINVTEDESGGWSGKKWFAYSTIYSSPDGTGWYCMPEQGDSVRLYFPSDKEEDAYVNSSVNKESSDQQARSNPDNKSIKNKQGKEVLFMPDKLVLTNNNGMSVEIHDNNGITLESDKEITIKAKDNIGIISGEQGVQMVAAEKIILEQGETVMELMDHVKMSGGQVNMQ